MPRARNPWFRFYVEAVHDRKLRRQDPAVRWLWVAMLAVARESPVPGTLLLADTGDDADPMDEHDLADVAALDVGTVIGGLAEFERLGMIERDGAWRIVKWGDRQFESDDVTRRTTKHRAKERGGNVPTSFPGTPPETETETEKNNTPPTPPDGGEPTQTGLVLVEPTKPKRRKGKRPLPDGWQPNDTHHGIAAEEHVDIGRAEQDFRDYLASSGRQYVDYDAAFRKWLRSDLQKRAGPSGNGRVFLTAAEQRTQRNKANVASALDRMAAAGVLQDREQQR